MGGHAITKWFAILQAAAEECRPALLIDARLTVFETLSQALKCIQAITGLRFASLFRLPHCPDLDF